MHVDAHTLSPYCNMTRNCIVAWEIEMRGFKGQVVYDVEFVGCTPQCGTIMSNATVFY